MDFFKSELWGLTTIVVAALRYASNQPTYSDDLCFRRLEDSLEQGRRCGQTEKADGDGEENTDLILGTITYAETLHYVIIDAFECL